MQYPQDHSPRSLLTRFILAVAFFCLSHTLQAADIEYTPILSTGDPITPEWAPADATISLIFDPIWVGPRVALRFRDDKSRSYSAFWDPFTQKVEYVAGPGMPFPSFGSNSSPVNAEGDPPVSPYIQNGLLHVATGARIFAGKTPVEDEGTVNKQDFWNAFITASSSGLTQWKEPFQANPLMISPSGQVAYVEDYGDNLNQLAWLYSDGGVEVIYDPSADPIPQQLTNASHFFPGNPIRITSDESLILASSYNKISGAGAGYAYFCVTIDSIMTLLVSSDSELPTHEDIPDGGEWLINDTGLTVDETGKVYFNATVRKTGEFIRRTVWSVSKDAPTPVLELTSEIEYETTNSGPTVFTYFSTPLLDDDGNLYFFSQVEGENDDSIWKRTPTHQLTRLSPPYRSAIPGVEGFTLTDARPVAVSPSGKLVAAFSSLESNAFRGYYLQDSNGNWVLIARNGQPLENFGDSIEVIEFAFNYEDELSMLIRIGFDYKLLYVRNLSDLTPSGNSYVWDGGAGDNNWHTVVNGRSNWVDNLGVPWPTPPQNSEASVYIDKEHLVEITDEAVHVDNIDLVGASLVNNGVTLVLESSLLIDEESSLTLKSGTVSGEIIHSSGPIIKEGNGTATITTDFFALYESDLAVEEGTLQILSKSIFEDAGIGIDGGKLILGEEVTFQGLQGIDLTASTEGEALVIADATDLIFKADLLITLEANSIATIGEATTETPIQFSDPREEGAFIQIDITGAGQVQVLTPLDLEFSIEIHNKGGTLSHPSLTFNTVVPSQLHTLTNTGYAQVASGGFSGQFLNSGTLLLGSEESPQAPVHFDCINTGTILQKGSATFNQLTARDGSLHFLSSSVDDVLTLKSNASPNPYLDFEPGSNLTLASGSYQIEFPDSDILNYSARTTLRENSSLHITNANFDGPTSFRVPKDSTVILEDSAFSELFTRGAGSTQFRGAIEIIEEDSSQFDISTQHFRLVDVQVTAPLFSEKEFSFQFYPDAGLKQAGDISGLLIGPDIAFSFSGNTTVISDINLTINGTLDNFGHLTLLDSVAGSGFLNIGPGGTLKTGPFDVEISPALEVASGSDPSQEASTGATIEVDSSSNLIINLIYFDDGENSAGKIYGNWIIGNGGSCTINDSKFADGITTIQPRASITLNRPHATLPSLVNLPTPQTDLVNFGSLTINNTTLDVTGGTFRNKKDFHIGPNAKIIGNIQSLRNELQGTPVLAGNLNIEGDLETDGLISLGASPGQGLITGDLTLHPESEMRVEFAGKEPGTEFDFLEIGGTANLDGILYLSLIDGYIPEVDDTFQFLQSETISGSFAIIDQQEMGRERRFDLNTTSNGLILTANAIQIATYADWRSYFFSESEAIDDAISGPLGDPDFDGVNNLSEYLHATLPHRSNAPPFTFDLSDWPALSGNVQWARNIQDYDWELEISANLQDWETIDFTSEQIEDLGNKVIHRIQASPTLLEPKELFYRFKAIEKE